MMQQYCNKQEMIMEIEKNKDKLRMKIVTIFSEL